MSTGTGPSPSNTSNTNSTPTPSTSTRSRLLLSTSPPTSSAASTSITSTPKASSQFSTIDEKLFSKYSNTLVSESNRRKADALDHLKRLAELRKETEFLDHTDWMYEPVEKLLGK
ncbi:hypothetical protein Fcan01_13126 [Folsomia candida]|uniref:Uncharacterized protein n=1 Tax=Folsomia candida TaxID=158441 RepID=A0A226E5U3_FOLCA|nr:hypothetical protein Fcan01_13126 [Folsomia candida]